MEADCVSHSIIIIILVVYFLQENFKTSLVIPLKEKILEKSDICLFSSRTRTLKELMTAILGQNKVEGVVKVPSKQAADQARVKERSGLVIDCLTRDQGAEGSSLTGVTVLCP